MAKHAFSAHQRELRDKWFNLVELVGDEWEDLGPVGEGESQSIEVKNKVDRMMGVAKPGPARGVDVDHYRAANEKLAFDLAHLLGLPVSAVGLLSRDMPGNYKRGRAISSWAFPQAKKWNVADSEGLLTSGFKQASAPIVAMMRAFHTWIGDADRKADHIIVDLSSPETDPRLAFIDHGHSLSYTFKAPNHAGTVCPHYLGGVPEDSDALAAAAAAISGVPDAEIERVVNRIPGSYLPDPAKAHIVSNLSQRKGGLRSLIGF